MITRRSCWRCMRSGRRGRGMRSRKMESGQHEFESSFLYKETPDQLTAIAASRRIWVGAAYGPLNLRDVGFGKTEVAIRGAFKAVMSGKQVAVLAPTTVLAAATLADVPGADVGYRWW